MAWQYSALAGDSSLVHAVSPAERLSQAGLGPSSSNEFWTKTRGAIVSCRCPAIYFTCASQAISLLPVLMPIKVPAYHDGLQCLVDKAVGLGGKSQG